jgi:hypothetical protein
LRHAIKGIQKGAPQGYFHYPVFVFRTNLARKAAALALANHDAKALPLIIESNAALLLRVLLAATAHDS